MILFTFCLFQCYHKTSFCSLVGTMHRISQIYSSLRTQARITFGFRGWLEGDSNCLICFGFGLKYVHRNGIHAPTFLFFLWEERSLKKQKWRYVTKSGRKINKTIYSIVAAGYKNLLWEMVRAEWAEVVFVGELVRRFLLPWIQSLSLCPHPYASIAKKMSNWRFSATQTVEYLGADEKKSFQQHYVPASGPTKLRSHGKPAAES